MEALSTDLVLKIDLRRAVWDAARGLWRFNQATTRYFFCDRRRLRANLVPIFHGEDSRSEINRDLREIFGEAGATLLAFGDPPQPGTSHWRSIPASAARKRMSRTL